MTTLQGGITSTHRAAETGVAGLLSGPMKASPRPVKNNAAQVMRAALVGGACVTYFGNGVSTFDRGVDKLNSEYATAAAGHFGVSSTDSSGKAKPEATLTDDVADAKAGKLAELKKRYAGLEKKLDGEASKTATMLEKGPNDEKTILNLLGTGALSVTAIPAFPRVDISKSPDAQRKLLEYLRKHPDELLSPPAWLQKLIAAQPYEFQVKVKVEQRMEQLRRKGLLEGPNPGGYYEEWIRNTIENGVPIETVISIARDHDIRPDDFKVLDGLKRIEDGDGKSFFLLDTDMTGDEARRAVLMTYILNAGTDYSGGDFRPEAYSSAEVQRIIDRQLQNSWTYDDDVAFVHSHGGRLVATPNGMLIGAGGDELIDAFSTAGGTTWGDTFMLNENDVEDPEQRLEEIIRSSYAPESTSLDLDRLLHHEERHSRQWAHYGHDEYIARYAWAVVTSHGDGCLNRYEEDAGPSDGGYDCDHPEPNPRPGPSPSAPPDTGDHGDSHDETPRPSPTPGPSPVPPPR
ncbi:MAG TPA: hypothetical protein VEX15_04390 [Nocardioidaceae bacterium]|nr:hypothetical protein [Nocardioidaceae bacterium]